MSEKKAKRLNEGARRIQKEGRAKVTKVRKVIAPNSREEQNRLQAATRKVILPNDR